ncbi:MAG: hypothetical protein A2Y21_09855 [Clostridiales bacterium GWC2_40_7]|nr:MAG: hypothetical protein A2Y21_09855 [Clostridiales bacterium GWC2_40_7]
MTRILIADDEYFVREGLISGIQWERYGFEVVGQAENGKQALEKIKELKPDILITDIKMPVMNGLELIREVRSLGLQTAIVILTCYSDFEYAKQAIKYGVHEYILKLSAQPEEILSVLNNVKEKYLTGGNNNKSGGNRLASFDAIDFKEYDKLWPGYVVVFKHVDTQMKYDAELIDGFSKIFSECKNEIFNCKHGYIAFINCQSESFVKALCSKLCNNISFRIFIGISELCSQPGKAGEMIEQAETAAGHYFYETGQNIFLHSCIKYEYVKFKNDEAQVLSSLEGFDEKALLEYSEEMFNQIKGVKPSYYISYCIEFLFLLVRYFRKNDITILPEYSNLDLLFKHFTRFTSMSEVKKEVIGIIKQLLNEFRMNSSQYSLVVARIKKIVDERYQAELKLEDIAGELNMNYSYLSNIFNRELGQSFKEYVNEVRVNFAKEFLKQGMENIYLVSEKVGYTNPYYFNKVFKKLTGMTPGEYRNKYTRI